MNKKIIAETAQYQTITNGKIYQVIVKSNGSSLDTFFDEKSAVKFMKFMQTDCNNGYKDLMESW